MWELRGESETVLGFREARVAEFCQGPSVVTHTRPSLFQQLAWAGWERKR